MKNYFLIKTFFNKFVSVFEKKSKHTLVSILFSSFEELNLYFTLKDPVMATFQVALIKNIIFHLSLWFCFDLAISLHLFSVFLFNALTVLSTAVS